MKFYVGTSGYGYKEWKGSFYPAKMKPAEMLTYYAERFEAVEINNTFYQLPSESVIEGWCPQTPGAFRFVLKAPQTITHRKRLKNCEAETKQFLELAGALKRRRGPLLFQLPPNFKKDLPRLEAFLGLLGKTSKSAFEFRHASWFDEEVFALLRKHRCTLAIADMVESPSTELVRTTDWGYVRLRRERYTAKQLKLWIERIESQNWKEVYVFFKHEDTGTGPKLATRLLELIER